ncbi:MAG: hypothetical protein R3E89_05880 [Thiolinea sp.]
MNLLAIYLPDSRGEPKDTGEFIAIKSYQQLMPAGYPEKASRVKSAGSGA